MPMRRRAFIAAVGSAVASPVAAWAQQTTTQRRIAARGTQVSSGGAGSPAVGFSFTADFGAVGDGSKDNSSAWNALASAARTASAAGKGVVLRLDPGVYNYDHSRCLGFLQNIANVHV